MFETEKEIQDLITNQIEESINLDFKRGDSLLSTPAGKKEIAKDVSAFANSDGGTIIYGMDENNHVASSIVSVDGNVITKEWLDQVISSNIHRRISGVIITPIRMGGNISTTVYVVTIPRSLEAPHMTSAKRYYKRFNFESVEMEEYEIRDLYSRPNQVNLEIIDVIIENVAHPESSHRHYVGDPHPVLRLLEFHLAFQIENTSNGIEELYKLEIETNLYFYSSHEPFNPIRDYFIRKDGDYSIYSIPNKSPLFQNEKTTVIRAAYNLERSQLLKEAHKTIKCKLYYSTGFKEKVYYLHDILTYQGRPYKEIFT